MKFYIYNNVSKLVGKSEILYRIWLKVVLGLFKGEQKKLPDLGDDFYFDGYPRSGNTFTKGLISYVFPNITGKSHLHSKTGIKIAIRKQLTVFIMLRNPADAVVSNLFRKIRNGNKLPKEKLIDILLLRYLRYYEYVEHHIDSNISILKFESFIQENKKEKYLLLISEILNLDPLTSEEISDNCEKFEIYFAEAEHEKKDSISSLPNEVRKDFKKENKAFVTESKYYQQCYDIYSRLSEFDMFNLKQ